MARLLGRQYNRANFPRQHGPALFYSPIKNRIFCRMTEMQRFTGGCLCGALRYEAEGEPLYAGHCYCTDCQRVSGSGFIPFLGFSADAVRFSGSSKAFVSKAANGGDATRNFCLTCNSLVFGGVVGESDSFTIYVGSLDD